MGCWYVTSRGMIGLPEIGSKYSGLLMTVMGMIGLVVKKRNAIRAWFQITVSSENAKAVDRIWKGCAVRLLKSPDKLIDGVFV